MNHVTATCSLVSPCVAAPCGAIVSAALTLSSPQDHIPVPYQPDSSSNPSSTTSSTPSSPAPPLPPSATPPSPLHPSPQCPRQQKQFNLPGTKCVHPLQMFSKTGHNGSPGSDHPQGAQTPATSTGPVKLIGSCHLHVTSLGWGGVQEVGFLLLFHIQPGLEHHQRWGFILCCLKWKPQKGLGFHWAGGDGAPSQMHE